MDEIRAFAAARGATYPIFDKVDVNGDGEAPLFAYLKQELGTRTAAALSFAAAKTRRQMEREARADVDWNFGKFLVDGDGEPVKRFAPTDSPLSIASDIEALL